MNIGNFLQKEYLERFEICYPATLFPPHFSSLKVGRCPLCSAKLKSPKHGKIFFCHSKKHAKPFIIKAERMAEMLK